MVIVATPTRGQLEASTASDIFGLLKHSPDSDWAIGFGTIVSNNRTLLVHTAAKAQASHILFVDSDMRFPPDSLERLLGANKDIVGANYRQRTRDEYSAHKGDEFISSKGKTGLEEVDSIGLGLALINMKLFTGFTSLPPSAFAMPFDASVGTFVGEDVYFCTIAREAGYKVWVDHDLSQQVKHIGSIEL